MIKFYLGTGFTYSPIKDFAAVHRITQNIRDHALNVWNVFTQDVIFFVPINSIRHFLLLEHEALLVDVERLVGIPQILNLLTWAITCSQISSVCAFWDIIINVIWSLFRV